MLFLLHLLTLVLIVLKLLGLISIGWLAVFCPSIISVCAILLFVGLACACA